MIATSSYMNRWDRHYNCTPGLNASLGLPAIATIKWRACWPTKGISYFVLILPKHQKNSCTFRLTRNMMAPESNNLYRALNRALSKKEPLPITYSISNEVAKDMRKHIFRKILAFFESYYVFLDQACFSSKDGVLGIVMVLTKYPNFCFHCSQDHYACLLTCLLLSRLIWSRLLQESWGIIYGIILFSHR